MPPSQPLPATPPGWGTCACAAGFAGEACEHLSATRRNAALLVAGVALAATLSLAAAAAVAYGRLVRGLSLAEMRAGRWSKAEDEGWRPGTATNALPGARYERFEAAKPPASSR